MSQRILDFMEKGTKLRDVIYVLKNCKTAKIAVNAQMFVGFPTETRKEAHRTINFALKNKRYIHSIGFGQYLLQRGSKVFKYPARYKVTNIVLSQDGNLNFYLKSGMSRKAVRKLATEAKKKLSSVYPSLTFPFNGCDSHTLLFVSLYGTERFRNFATKYCNRFLLKNPRDTLLNS